MLRLISYPLKLNFLNICVEAGGFQRLDMGGGVRFGRKAARHLRKALLCGEEIKVWCKVWYRHKNNRLILA